MAGKHKTKKNLKKGLNARQQVFVNAYLTCWNASEAARQAGYKNRANTAGAQMMSNNVIRTVIDARLAEMGMGADEVLARLASHARGDLTNFLTQNGEVIGIDLTSKDAKANLHLVKKVHVHRRVTTRKNEDVIEESDTDLELHDPQAALVHLGRHLKLFTDKVEVDDSGISNEERAARITALLDKARARRT